MASSYLVQEEDGHSRFALEQGGGFILLETEGVETVEVGGIEEHGVRVVTDEAEVMLTVLAIAAKRRRW